MPRVARFAVGPVFGLVLFGAAVFLGFGPGFLVLAACGAVGFLVVTPLIQFALGRTTYFATRPTLSAALGAIFVVASIAVAIASGKFFYW